MGHNAAGREDPENRLCTVGPELARVLKTARTKARPSSEQRP